MRRFSALSALWVLFWATACSPSSQESLGDARDALNSGDYAAALAAAEAGMAGAPDEVTAWGLSLVKLEALARQGSGEEALAQLDALAGQRPEQVPADQYAATADQLRAAGQGEAAIQALDRGLKRFPDDAQLAAQIEEVTAGAAAGSDELELLRSLGYVE